MAKDPVILESGTRVRRQDEIIKDAEKLVDLLFGGNAGDQVDGRRSQATEHSNGTHPTGEPSSRLFHSLRSSEDSDAELHRKCARVDGRTRGTRAPLALPESSTVTPASSPSTEEPDDVLLPSPGIVDCDREPDEVDGFPSALAFTDKPEEEKDEILTEIAEALRTIGDSYEQKGCAAAASVSNLLNVSLATDVVEKLASNLTYENFKDAISRAMGDEPGLQQFVFAYRLASAVASRVGSSESREAASRFYLSYLTSNLVGWVERSGGWRGVLKLMLR